MNINTSFLSDLLAADKSSIQWACTKFAHDYKPLTEALGRTCLPSFATIPDTEKQRSLQTVFLALLLDEVNLWNPHTKAAQQAKVQGVADELKIDWDDIDHVGRHCNDLLKLVNSRTA